jgi:hypothetical protein
MRPFLPVGEGISTTTEELTPLPTLKASIGRAAQAFTEKHIGPRARLGNKGGTLANRLRAVIAGKK